MHLTHKGGLLVLAIKIRFCQPPWLPYRKAFVSQQCIICIGPTHPCLTCVQIKSAPLPDPTRSSGSVSSCTVGDTVGLNIVTKAELLPFENHSEEFAGCGSWSCFTSSVFDLPKNVAFVLKSDCETLRAVFKTWGSCTIGFLISFSTVCLHVVLRNLVHFLWFSFQLQLNCASYNLHQVLDANVGNAPPC